MLNKQQIKLVQIAVKKAGLREPKFDGRYRMLLSQYKQPNGQPVTSCKQLNSWQVDDLLAICEAHGWRYPGKDEDHYRKRIANKDDIASYAQQSAIEKLAGDLGWNDRNLAGFVNKMTKERVDSVLGITPSEAYKIIEALKAMYGREAGRPFNSLHEIQDSMEAKADGREVTSRQIG